MTEKQYNEEKALIKAAHILSVIFSPIYLPFIAFLALFLFSYLSILPLQFKAIVLGIVYGFTILMPVLFTFLLRKINLHLAGDGHQKQRYLPLLLTFVSYILCLVIMFRLHLPWYMNNIVVVVLLILLICIIANLKWQLSEHMAGMGALIGGVVAFSELFHYNPTGWLCLCILVAGLLGTARIILQHHTLGEVSSGFAVGLLCSLLLLHPGSRLLIYLFSHALR